MDSLPPILPLPGHPACAMVCRREPLVGENDVCMSSIRAPVATALFNAWKWTKDTPERPTLIGIGPGTYAPVLLYDSTYKYWSPQRVNASIIDHVSR